MPGRRSPKADARAGAERCRRQAAALWGIRAMRRPARAEHAVGYVRGQWGRWGGWGGPGGMGWAVLDNGWEGGWVEKDRMKAG